MAGGNRQTGIGELRMRILETFCEGKTSAEANEDRIVFADGYAAVIDGATDKTGLRLGGKAGGVLVADALKALFEGRAGLSGGLGFHEFVAVATDAVAAALKAAGWPEGFPPPCASIVVFNERRRELWRVGDCHYAVGDEVSLGSKAIDDLTSSMRAAVIRRALDRGQDLNGKDPGREVIMPMLQAQHLHANNAESPVGFPVMDGRPVPESLLERPVTVGKGDLVVLASDGFDFLKPTLRETLEAQERSYRIDPLRIGLPGGRASTKGLPQGAIRHDDQSYVSLMA